MNANPSGSRTPPTGGRGRSKARREHAVITEPSPGLARATECAGTAGAADRPAWRWIGGTRHAMMACRGALSERLNAQGRVGGHSPRHIVGHPASHPLLLAHTSARSDAVRPLCPVGVRFWPMDEETVRMHSSRPKAQPRDRSSPRLGARRDTELVQPENGVIATPACGLSGGKGVLEV